MGDDTHRLWGYETKSCIKMKAFGGLAMPLPWDAVTSTVESVETVLNKISKEFPAPRFLPHTIIYNAGALSWLSVPETSIKKLDL